MYEDVIKVSKIEIAPIPPREGLVAFASFILNESYFVGNVCIYTSYASPDGFRLVYPTKMGISCFHPINRRVGEKIQKEVIGRYLEIVEKLKGGEEKKDEHPKTNNVKADKTKMP